MRKLILMVAMAVGASTGSSVVLAESSSIIDLNLSSDAVRARYVNTRQDSSGTGVQFDFGYLFSEGENGAEDVGVAHVGLLAVGNAAGSGDSKILAGVGARAYLLDADASDGAAIGIGGAVRGTLAGFNRLGLGAHLYFAPDVIAFNDIERFLEYGVRAEYEVLRNARIYAGYRHVSVKIDGAGNETLDTGMLGGLQIVF